MTKEFLFTSESVAEGHPDKICDQISDAILDSLIAGDPTARVACEVMVKDNQVVLGGEIKTTAVDSCDYDVVIRRVIRDIGYTDDALGFCADSCTILDMMGLQSADISQGVDRGSVLELGAGDQGMMFGYATNETDEYMPAPIYYAHRLLKKYSEIRKNNTTSFFRPDAKSQLTFHYRDSKPCAVGTVVFSAQHTPELSDRQDVLQEALMEEVIKPVLPAEWLTKHTKICINPTGRFEVGGPKGDCGLTGRKIIVDTYGGMARHGGGAFSGKDPSKVDRSAAYAARYIAKNIVAAGLAERCEIQLSYAIGVVEPVSIMVETFGTAKVLSDSDISKLINEHFDLRPGGIIQMLDLNRPIYEPTACYGHFGRSIFPWEKLDKVSSLTR